MKFNDKEKRENDSELLDNLEKAEKILASQQNPEKIILPVKIRINGYICPEKDILMVRLSINDDSIGIPCAALADILEGLTEKYKNYCAL